MEWAAQAAMTRDLPLALLYATRFTGPLVDDGYPIGEVEAAGHEILNAAKAQVADRFPDLVCTTEFAHEDPAAALVDASAQAALVVVGNRGHGGFHDLLLGSTSLHTAMHAYGPVAVVRPTVARDGGAAGRIVVGVDGSEHGRVALQLAFAEAQLTGRPITAAYAYVGTLTGYRSPFMPHVPDPETERQRAADFLAGELRFWRAQHPSVGVDEVVTPGSASAVLVRLSRGAHLAVVGSRGRGGFAGLMFGSTGHALIHHAGCPVLVAHHPK